MKSLILAISLFAGAQAFAAAQNCAPQYIGTGEGQGYTVYPCEKPVTTHRGCNEGEVGYFPTGTYTSEGGPYEERRICHHGTFFPEYTGAPVKVKACIEGEITYISNGYYGAEGGPAEDMVVCHNGRFVKP